MDHPTSRPQSAADQIQFLCECAGIRSSQIKPALVTPIPETIKQYFRRAKKKDCYNNAFVAASSLDNASYIVGYWIPASIGIPIEHAWVGYKNHYYDPTSEMGLGDDVTKSQYFSVFQLPILEALKIMEALDINHAPGILEIIKSRRGRNHCLEPDKC